MHHKEQEDTTGNEETNKRYTNVGAQPPFNGIPQGVTFTSGFARTEPLDAVGSPLKTRRNPQGVTYLKRVAHTDTKTAFLSLGGWDAGRMLARSACRVDLQGWCKRVVPAGWRASVRRNPQGDLFPWA